MSFPLIDVIIPCYNAEQTLERAVKSILNQPHLGTLWLIDDASTGQTLLLAQQFATQYPEKIKVEQMPRNSGVAKTRNWGALQSAAEIIAFLDADDAYESQALTLASSVFHFRPEILVLRLALTLIGMVERYSSYPNFEFAWQHMRMTCGGNVVFRRAFFLACGGFPQHQLFRELGGEDGALGIATTQVCQVGTLFNEPGVLHYCRDGMHAEWLLEAILFNKVPKNITTEQMAEAQAVTDNICRQIEILKCGLNSESFGVIPLVLERV